MYIMYIIKKFILFLILLFELCLLRDIDLFFDIVIIIISIIYKIFVNKFRCLLCVYMIMRNVCCKIFFII